MSLVNIIASNCILSLNLNCLCRVCNAVPYPRLLKRPCTHWTYLANNSTAATVRGDFNKGAHTVKPFCFDRRQQATVSTAEQNLSATMKNIRHPLHQHL